MRHRNLVPPRRWLALAVIANSAVAVGQESRSAPLRKSSRPSSATSPERVTIKDGLAPSQRSAVPFASSVKKAPSASW